MSSNQDDLIEDIRNSICFWQDECNKAIHSARRTARIQLIGASGIGAVWLSTACLCFYQLHYWEGVLWSIGAEAMAFYFWKQWDEVLEMDREIKRMCAGFKLEREGQLKRALEEQNNY